MNEDYWARFEMTGKVEDYLTYKGITAHKARKRPGSERKPEG